MAVYRNYRELTPEDIALLAELYPVTPNRQLAQQFGISVDALQDYVAYPRGWKKDRKATQIGNRNGRTLKEREVKWIINHFKHTKNEDIMRKYGIGESQLHRVARKYGLKKSRQFAKKAQWNATEAAHKANKEYGIYEQTRERMRQQAAERKARGERIPGSFIPGQSNKDRLSPKRFKECIEKSRQSRKETIRKERIRIHYGLPQKTKIHLHYEGYTAWHRKKSIHRHLFRKHGYIVEYGDDTVYYDDQTLRHHKMEANAHLYGLKVEKLLEDYS